jgi:hypothetical protein
MQSEITTPWEAYVRVLLRVPIHSRFVTPSLSPGQNPQRPVTGTRATRQRATAD